MPIDYNNYPPNWKTEIRPRILKRAENKCEFCGLDNHIVGARDAAGRFWTELEINNLGKIGQRKVFGKEGYKLFKIVLTIAHLDHDPQNMEVQDDRLRALCQKCHIGYDKKHQKLERAKKRYKGSLFEME